MELTFSGALCVRGGHGYKEGNVYPVLGWNNGISVLCEDDKGNVMELVCHNYGDEIRDPDDTDNGPVFEYVKLKVEE